MVDKNQRKKSVLVALPLHHRDGSPVTLNQIPTPQSSNNLTVDLTITYNLTHDISTWSMSWVIDMI